MSDVLLTATNPADSSVVPVACNEKGELKLEEPILVEGPQGEKGDKGDSGDPFSGNFAGHVTFSSTLTWAGDKGVLTADGGASFINGGFDLTVSNFAPSATTAQCKGLLTSSYFICSPSINSAAGDYSDTTWSNWQGLSLSDQQTSIIYASGRAEFAGDVVVGSRNSQWMIVESNGLAHLVEQTSRIGDPVANTEYPQLRNIPGELDLHNEVLKLLRTEVQKIEEKLRLTPEAGWDVWDGSD